MSGRPYWFVGCSTLLWSGLYVGAPGLELVPNYDASGQVELLPPPFLSSEKTKPKH